MCILCILMDCRHRTPTDSVVGKEIHHSFCTSTTDNINNKVYLLTVLIETRKIMSRVRFKRGFGRERERVGKVLRFVVYVNLLLLPMKYLNCIMCLCKHILMPNNLWLDRIYYFVCLNAKRYKRRKKD